MCAGKRGILISFMAVLTVLAMAIGVYAYLSTNSEKVDNSFAPAPEIDPTISESFDHSLKENVGVSVGDTSYSVYVRADIIVTWKNDQGDVYAQKPVLGRDYEISINTQDWFEHEGFYYYKVAVNSGGTTQFLISSCTKTGTTPEGYQLSVQILAQTIQATGTTDATDTEYPEGKPAVTDAWGVKVSNGILTKP